MNITHLNPCDEAAEWLLTQPDAQTAWDSCERPDWMLWYLGETGCSHQTLVTIACRIARTVVHLAPPEALTAIEAAERWVLDQSETNRAAADAAVWAAAWAADAAAWAADAAAARAATRAAYAAAHAADAAYAAARAATYAATYAAAASVEHCRIIREVVPECL
jgi:hypothetical protein